jgi:hypothetical protein
MSKKSEKTETKESNHHDQPEINTHTINIKTAKQCTVCKQLKSKDEFYKVGGKCKECVKAKQRERNKKAKELENEIKTKPELRDKPKICSVCNKTKTVGDFRVNRSGCIDCERAYGRDYNQENPEIRKQWQEDNKEHFARLQANNHQKNKSKICEKYKERYASDKCFKIRGQMKAELSNVIKKIKSTENYMGEKFERVAEWLEYNFTDEMNWENHGSFWDIDHVIPICKWDSKNDGHIEMCFNWKNLSPLQCAKNRNEKREKMDDKQLKRHIKNLRKYFAEKCLDETELDEYLEKYCAYAKNIKKKSEENDD